MKFILVLVLQKSFELFAGLVKDTALVAFKISQKTNSRVGYGV